MKEQILESLKNIHEAKTLMEINDLLGLKTVEELKELQKNMEELVRDFEVFKTKKDNIYYFNYISCSYILLFLYKREFNSRE